MYVFEMFDALSVLTILRYLASQNVADAQSDGHKDNVKTIYPALSLLGYD